MTETTNSNIISNPLPSVTATTSAAVGTTILMTGLGWLASHYGVPQALTTAIIGGLVSVFTSLWHRMQGPRTVSTTPAKP